MRVLLLPIPGVGHAFQLVPLAWALRSAGHDVLFATAGGGLVVERAGMPVADIRLGKDRPEIFTQLAKRHPDLDAKMRGDDSEGIRDLSEMAVWFAELSAAVAPEVVDFAAGWRPDLVVHSSFHGSALVAAAKLGVPSVEYRDGFGRSTDLSAQMYEHMADAFAAHGATGLPERRTSIDIVPPSMVDGLVDLPMRYVPFNGGSVVPEWLRIPVAELDRPRVAVTLGTVSPGMAGLSGLSSLLAAAGDLDAEFIFALGDVDTAALRTVPPNVHIAGWVPLTDLLPTCAAVIHHGGGGTILTAMANGIPQLLLPDGSDGYVNAAAVSARKCGTWAKPADVDGALVERLITDRELRSGAAQVREEMARMPAPSSVVPVLERMVA